MGGSLAAVWRRFARWVRTGDGAPQPDRELDSAPRSRNACFVADLNEAQRLAVLGAIYAARRPLSDAVRLD